MIIDAKDCIVGRLGSYVAKKLLEGNEIILINAEKAIISGNKRNIIEKYLARRRVKQKANPEHSPKWPKRPDLLLRRIIRGMLPYDKAKGRQAYKRLKVYINFPKELQEKLQEKLKDEKIEVVEFSKKEIQKFITVGDLCKELGWKG
ncbi:MAG: 50S ribosomal protein L13 [Candidatus Micrarchaeia archaeon]